MQDHLDLSRITKALTDVYDVDFSEAEQRLDSVRLAVVLDSSASAAAAAQACVLTVLATARRSFNEVKLVAASDVDVDLLRPQPRARTLFEAARDLGIQVTTSVPVGTTHTIAAGAANSCGTPFLIRCWWDGWLGGVLSSWDDRPNGEGWNPLAGVLAGALAVREVFAAVRGVKLMKLGGNVVSLWEPWSEGRSAEAGPSTIYLPRSMAVVGLGHLGQGLLWNLCLLPGNGDLLVLQDFQEAGRENAATGLLTSHQDIGRRKTRIASDWCEHFGWKTALVERKFARGTSVTSDDPAVVISALDSADPRRHILAAGFHRMLDIGVGHGPVDFEIGQFRSFVVGDEPTWMGQTEALDVDVRMRRKAYTALKDACGAFPLASASVAVPFVGAAMGALCLAQLLRLGAMKRVPKVLQFEMSAPEQPSCGQLADETPAGFGGVPIDLIARNDCAQAL